MHFLRLTAHFESTTPQKFRVNLFPEASSLLAGNTRSYEFFIMNRKLDCILYVQYIQELPRCCVSKRVLALRKTEGPPGVRHCLTGARRYFLSALPVAGSNLSIRLKALTFREHPKVKGLIPVRFRTRPFRASGCSGLRWVRRTSPDHRIIATLAAKRHPEKLPRRGRDEVKKSLECPCTTDDKPDN